MPVPRATRRAFPALLLCAAALAAAPHVIHAQASDLRSTAQQRTVIRGVTVVDVEQGTLLPNRDVTLADGHIVQVAPTSPAAPGNALIIDGAGRFLIPGLWDFHVHSAYPFLDALLMPLYIANGVTGVREMFGDLRTIAATRQKFVDKSAIVPRIVGAGHIVDGPNPIWPNSVVAANPSRAVTIVDSLREAGADFIKVYSLLSRETFLAIANAAKARGIRFAGHVPESVSIREASAAGMWTMEHLYGITAACSAQEDAIRARLDSAGGSLAAMQRGRNAVAELIATTFSEPKCVDLFAELARNASAQVPTLTVIRGITFMNDSAFRSDARLRYVPSFLRAGWDPAKDPRFKDRTAADWERARRSYAMQLTLIKPMAAAGVPIVAGTDVLNPYIIPGFSLHDELQLFVENGLTPIQALRAATLVPARLLNATDSLGTVAQGKVADLVLLDANPLADIHNTTRIRAVISNGRVFDRAALDSLLAAAERAANPESSSRR